MIGRAAAVSAFLLTAHMALAVPAKPGIHAYPMPDGSTVSVSIVGDEHSRYYLSSDGYVLLPDEKGALRYATTDMKGEITLSDFVAADVPRRSPEAKSFLSQLDKSRVLEMTESVALDNMRKSKAKMPSSIVTNYPTTGSPTSMVILVQFKDIKFQTPNPKEAFTNLVRQDNYTHGGATGSALQYFKDNSNGVFSPDFEVFGPVTLPENEPYYGAGSAMMYDNQGYLMARDAVLALRADYPDEDFSRFDNDKDGFVDNIFIFYAGYGENEGAPSWTIWPHSAALYDMYNFDLTYDGVKFNKYACTNELQGNSGQTLCGIGTFVHEFSHVLGLMDHYPTKLSGSARSISPGNWDVMDSGSYNNSGNTPPCLNAFERYTLGWLNPRKLTGPENISLSPLHSSNEALLIQTEKDSEFFILENRQREGWDAYLGGHGMLIWHVDYDEGYWSDNNINNDGSHQRFDLVEADGVFGDSSRNGDPFPGSNSVRSFTAESTPPMTTWINVDPDMPLTDIYEVDSQITFRVKGGGDALTPPTATEATEITPVSFRANWNLVPAINEYELDVCEGDASVPVQTVKVSNSVSHVVEGLKPGTKYSYVVRSCEGTRMSANSNCIALSTLPPSFDMLSPVAVGAESVTDETFVAKWQPMAEAAGYVLNVYTKTVVDPVAESADFTDGVVLPEGWTTNCTNTGSQAGYFGQSAPALRMTFDGDRVVSANYPGGINSFEFWYRGNSTDDAASLSVEIPSGNSWISLYEISPLVKTEGTVVSFGDNEGAVKTLPVGLSQIRLVFNKGERGSLSLDDILLHHDATFTPAYIAGYDKKDCGNTLMEAVCGLSRSTRYYYTVSAYNASGVASLPSNEIEVMTSSEPGSVSGIGMESGSSVSVANGVVRIRVNEASNVAVYTLDGRLVYTGFLSTGESRDVRIGVPGMYMVKAGKTFKVIL